MVPVPHPESNNAKTAKLSQTGLRACFLCRSANIRAHYISARRLAPFPFQGNGFYDLEKKKTAGDVARLFLLRFLMAWAEIAPKDQHDLDGHADAEDMPNLLRWDVEELELKAKR